MTFACLEFMRKPVPKAPQAPIDIQVEVADTPLPIGMRLHCLRSDVASSVRKARPRLPSLPPAATGIPAVGATALATMLVRDRRRTPR
ncbi:MAG: hypothetical protein M3490_10030 [Chloroflexota bacterium]|nr:hypothetical protein [Chloroflexota bacterium]